MSRKNLKGGFMGVINQLSLPLALMTINHRLGKRKTTRKTKRHTKRNAKRHTKQTRSKKNKFNKKRR